MVIIVKEMFVCYVFQMEQVMLLDLCECRCDGAESAFLTHSSLEVNTIEQRTEHCPVSETSEEFLVKGFLAFRRRYEY